MDKSIGFEIRAISNGIKRYINSLPAFLDNEVRGGYGYVIGFLYANSHRDVYQKDIEEEMSIRRSSVTNLLSQMEKYGLIERESVSGDGRLKKVVLTQKAVRIHENLKREIENVEDKLCQGMSRDEIDELMRLLTKVKSNMEKL